MKRRTFVRSALAVAMAASLAGMSLEAARGYFAQLWRILRPALAGRDAVPPGIWHA